MPPSKGLQQDTPPHGGKAIPRPADARGYGLNSSKPQACPQTVTQSGIKARAGTRCTTRQPPVAEITVITEAPLGDPFKHQHKACPILSLMSETTVA